MVETNTIKLMVESRDSKLESLKVETQKEEDKRIQLLQDILQKMSSIFLEICEAGLRGEFKYEDLNIFETEDEYKKNVETTFIFKKDYADVIDKSSKVFARMRFERNEKPNDEPLTLAEQFLVERLADKWPIIKPKLEALLQTYLSTEVDKTRKVLTSIKEQNRKLESFKI